MAPRRNAAPKTTKPERLSHHDTSLQEDHQAATLLPAGDEPLDNAVETGGLTTQGPVSFNGKLQHFEFKSSTTTMSTFTSAGAARTFALPEEESIRTDPGLYGLRRSNRTQANATGNHLADSSANEMDSALESVSRPTSRKRKLAPSDTTPVSSVLSPTTSPSTVKRRKSSSKYAPPSKYAHLSPLEDILAPNLICVFVGHNPGVRTAASGHAYAHPSNLFWKLLYSSGLTDRRCKPEEDVDLPRLYAMGNTNIVSRPTKDTAELSKAEQAAGTPILEEKLRQYKPEAVCIVGKSIWEAIWRWRYGKNPKKDEFKYGWQDEKENMGAIEGGEGEEPWAGARVFVTTSTSGLSASLKPAEKEAIWKPFGDWVQQRRLERAQAESN